MMLQNTGTMLIALTTLIALILGDVFADKGPECSFYGNSAAMFTTRKEVKGIKRIFSPYRAVFYSRIAGSL